MNKLTINIREYPADQYLKQSYITIDALLPNITKEQAEGLRLELSAAPSVSSVECFPYEKGGFEFGVIGGELYPTEFIMDVTFVLFDGNRAAESEAM